MKVLKQSTASQTRLLGPFIDDAGVDPETALTIANTDIRLSKNGANIAAKNSGGGTHDELGMYAVTFDATDTATVGLLQVVCKMAGALIVKDEYTVLEESVYDGFYASGASLDSATAVAAEVAAFTLSGETTAGSWSKSQQDTETAAAAVKAKTDQLSFGVTNAVDANLTNVAGGTDLVSSGTGGQDYGES